jgi:hypothetical protein
VERRIYRRLQFLKPALLRHLSHFHQRHRLRVVELTVQDIGRDNVEIPCRNVEDVGLGLVAFGVVAEDVEIGAARRFALVLASRRIPDNSLAYAAST